MMTVLVLNPDLTRIIRDVDNAARNHVLTQTIDPETNKREYDWHTRKQTTTTNEEFFNTNVPKDAAHYHTNYLGYLGETYAVHDKIVFAPQNFWYTILCEIARHVVGSAEKHRALFTRSPDKIDISVPCDAETEPLRMDDIYAAMIPYVPIDTSLFLPSFSTSTEMSRLASLAAFLETCSPYYNYMMLGCGHPEVKILGTKDDWAQIVERTRGLADEFEKVDSSLTPWLRQIVLPVAHRLEEAVDGEHADWFKTIYTEQRCGSGGQVEIDGWFSRLMMEQPPHERMMTVFPTHITRVPYATLPSGQKWKLCFGLFYSTMDDDGFMVPEFAWVQNRVLPEPKIETVTL